MAARGRRFSWMRLVSNAIPNMANDRRDDVDLTPAQADSLVEYQLTQPEPVYLTKDSFFVAGLTDSQSISTKVYKALVKFGIIAAAPSLEKTFTSASAASSGSAPIASPATSPVITRAIGKSFAHQLACISVHAQRKLVGMLFFWEEEVTRFQLLDAEEAEILSALDLEETRNADLEIALQAVEMRRKMLPSCRGEATANINSGVGHELPAYS